MSRRAPRASTRERTVAAPRPSARPAEPSRRGGRRVLCTLIALAVVATLAVASVWVLHTSYFRVSHLVIGGVDGVHVTSPEVTSLSGLGSHPAMIDVNTTSIEHRIESLAWVKHVIVHEKWPSTITITVIERQPVAVAYGAKGALVLVDSSGVPIAAVSTPANYPLLIAEGQRAGEPWPFTRWARAAALVAGSLPPAFSGQVDAIRVTRAGDVSLAMTSPITFELGPATNLRNKYVAVASVIAHGRVNPGDTVDVSVPSTVAVSGP